ncbi:hypothetical protein BGX38DRAFT_1110959, partial [Terfezia claveryi]
PIGELLNLWLYTINISNNSVTSANTIWSEDGEINTYRDTSLSITDLLDFLQDQLKKATTIIRT